MPIIDSPLVLVTADRSLTGLHYSHSAGEKYLTAVSLGAGCTPLVLPALVDEIDLDDLLRRVDGVLITGGYSNIEPHHYGQQPASDKDERDAERDRTNLALIPQVIDAGVPFLGICRGLQELNVALGGSLHQLVHEVGGMQDHREDKSASVDGQYGLSHRVSLQAGGILSGLQDEQNPMVNSVHGQGIDRLANGLRIEAIADDGLVEAVSVTDAQQFAVAVQWHPEWQVQNNSFYLSIFKAFGDACRVQAGKL